MTLSQRNSFVELSCYLAQLLFGIECLHLSTEISLFDSLQDAVMKHGLFFVLHDKLEDNHPQSPLYCCGKWMFFVSSLNTAFCWSVMFYRARHGTEWGREMIWHYPSGSKLFDDTPRKSLVSDSPWVSVMKDTDM